MRLVMMLGVVGGLGSKAVSEKGRVCVAVLGVVVAVVGIVGVTVGVMGLAWGAVGVVPVGRFLCIKFLLMK